MFASIKGNVQSIGGKVIGTDDELKQLRKENDELVRLVAQLRPGMGVGRVKALVEEKARHHAAMRRAMEDIVDTRTEKLVNMVHGNSMLNKAEASFKSHFYDKSGDTIGALESHIDWGNKYKPLGSMMTCTRLNPPQDLPVEFGRNMRLLYFHLDENFLNAASYGATPIPVSEARQQWDLANQANPVRWRFMMLPIRLRQAEQRVARYIGADPSDTKILINANAATSCVLKSLPWEVGDRMLIFDVDYDATKNACDWLRRNKGVEIITVNLALPMSDDEVLAAIKRKLDELQSTNPPMPKLANFCHVTSKTAWIFPAKRITKLLHSYGISVMCDGAQAAGHLDINVADIGADWYLGTIHKWMYSCQGVAFLVTQPHKQACTQPLTVSYFDGQGYLKEFSYYGLQDFSTWCATLDAFDFIEKVCGGMGNVRRYCREQAQRCVEILSREWGTQPFQVSQDHYGNMPIMPLPKAKGADQTMAAKVMGYLMSCHNITAFLLVADVGGAPTLCIRCSCQIYTDDNDWKRLAAAINQLGGNYGTLKVISEILPDSISAMVS